MYNEKERFAILSHKTYISIGVSYRQLGEYTKALTYYTRALDSQIEEFLDTIYNNVGVIYFNLHELNLSISFFEKALSIYKAKGEVENSIGILNNIIRINTIQKDFYMAENRILKVLEISKKNKNYIELINAKFNLANLKFELGQINDSYKILIKIQYMCKKYPNISLEYSIALLLAEVCNKMKKYNSCNRYFILAFNLSKKLSSYDFLKSLEKYIQYLEKQQKYEKALYYLKLYMISRNNSTSEEKSNHLSKSRILFESKEKQLTVERLVKLRKINKQLEAKAKQLNLRNIFLEKALNQGNQRHSVRSQFNVLFINNSINFVKNLILKNEKQNADKFILQFSKLTRDIFYFSLAKKIRLFDEINVLENYLEIESKLLRYISKYEFYIDPNINLKKTSIEPLYFQSIISKYMKSNNRMDRQENIIKVELLHHKKQEIEIIRLTIKNLCKNLENKKNNNYKRNFVVENNHICSKLKELYIIN